MMSQVANNHESERFSTATDFPGASEHQWSNVDSGQPINFQFAVIGDYGADSTAEGDVADLVKAGPLTSSSPPVTITITMVLRTQSIKISANFFMNLSTRIKAVMGMARR